MENECNCGYKAFYYQKTENYKKWDVYKCGHVMIESKRKTKCDMNNCVYVCDISIPETKEPVKFEQNKLEDPETMYKKQLAKYIDLCEITKHLPNKYRWNYIANINYLLKKLNFPLYFEEKETLESLKIRIKGKCYPKKIYKSHFPINLVEYPPCLSVIVKKEKKKTKTKTNTNTNTKTTVQKDSKKTTRVYSKYYLEEKEDPEDPEDPEEKEETDEVPKKKEYISESESESGSEEDENDNTFDIDNYDSGEDYEDLDDGGAFSD